MNSKEEWIAKTLESLDGATRAELNPFAGERILRKAAEPAGAILSLTSGVALKIAAVILLLISLNVFTLICFQHSSGGSSNATGSVANEYFSYIDHYNF